MSILSMADWLYIHIHACHLVFCNTHMLLISPTCQCSQSVFRCLPCQCSQSVFRCFLGSPRPTEASHSLMDDGDLALVDLPSQQVRDLGSAPYLPSGSHRGPATAVLRDGGNQLGLLHNDEVLTLLSAASQDATNFGASCSKAHQPPSDTSPTCISPHTHTQADIHTHT